MTKLQVDIPQKLIEEAAGKELKALQNKNKRLVSQNAALQRKIAEAERAISAFQSLRQFLADHFDLYEDYGL